MPRKFHTPKHGTKQHLQADIVFLPLTLAPAAETIVGEAGSPAYVQRDFTPIPADGNEDDDTIFAEAVAARSAASSGRLNIKSIAPARLSFAPGQDPT